MRSAEPHERRPVARHSSAISRQRTLICSRRSCLPVAHDCICLCDTIRQFLRCSRRLSSKKLEPQRSQRPQSKTQRTTRRAAFKWSCFSLFSSLCPRWSLWFNLFASVFAPFAASRLHVGCGQIARAVPSVISVVQFLASFFARRKIFAGREKTDGLWHNGETRGASTSGRSRSFKGLPH